MLRLDAAGEKLFRILPFLNEDERAIYALGMWRYCQHRGLYQKGLALLVEAAATSSQHPLPLRMQACLATGVLCRKCSKFSQADTYLNLALRMAHLLESKCEIGFIELHIGILYSGMGKLQEAQKHLEASIQAGSELEDHWVVGAAFNELGNLELHQMRFPEAESFYSNSLRHWELIKETKRGLETQINRAIVAAEMGNYEIAERIYKKSLSASRTINDPLFHANTLYNLGDVCIYTGKLQEAESYLISAYDLFCGIGTIDALPLVISGLGEVRFKENDFKNAVRLISYAQQLRNQSGIESTPLQVHEVNKVLEIIRNQIRANVFTMYWNQGKALTSEHIRALFKSCARESSYAFTKAH